jgi:hypothetical protein
MDIVIFAVKEQLRGTLIINIQPLIAQFILGLLQCAPCSRLKTVRQHGDESKAKFAYNKPAPAAYALHQPEPPTSACLIFTVVQLALHNQA